MGDKKPPLVEFTVHGKVTLGTIVDPNVLNPIHVMNFGKFVIAYVEKNPGANLLLSFDNVEFLSSSTITELIRIKDSLEGSGGRLALSGISDNIRKVFEITNMIKLLHVYSEPTDVAVQRLSRAADVAEQEAAWKEKHEKF